MNTTLLNEKTLQLQWEIKQQHLISERIESARKEAEQIFNVAVPLCVIDKNYRIHRVNDTFCELFDCRKDMVTGQRCSSIWHNGLCNTNRCPLWKVMSTGNPFNTEGAIRTGNGHRKICMVTAKPFYNAENQLTGIVENIIDISLRKKVEEELAGKKEQLLEQNLLLEKKNAALRELMEQIRHDKKLTEERILDNVEHLISPLIEKLKERCCEKETVFITMLETNLNELTSPFGSIIARNYLKLSSKEITIANMIRSGCDSKEIARLLHLSIKTVETHRKNIRRKLGITNSQKNLYSCLTTTC